MTIGEVTVDELETALASGARLFDVREVDEYVEGHIPGARLVVLGTVPANVDVFRGDGPAYLVCKAGGRSMQACQFLAAQGLEVVNVTGGTMAWVLSDRPVVAGDEPG
jgi:rhodanese-related sulfurtransferase